jgi:hypothetical protein
VNAVLGVCATWCMRYSVLTHGHHRERYRGMTYLCVLEMMVQLWTRKREMGDQDENDTVVTREYEISGGTPCQIRLGRPHSGVIAGQIAIHTYSVGDGKMAPTKNSPSPSF